MFHPRLSRSFSFSNFFSSIFYEFFFCSFFLVCFSFTIFGKWTMGESGYPELVPRMPNYMSLPSSSNVTVAFQVVIQIENLIVFSFKCFYFISYVFKYWNM